MRSEDEKRFDERVIERNLRDGVVDTKAVEAQLAALPDLAAEADRIDYAAIVAQPVGRPAARGSSIGLATEDTDEEEEETFEPDLE